MAIPLLKSGMTMLLQSKNIRCDLWKHDIMKIFANKVYKIPGLEILINSRSESQERFRQPNW